MVGESDEADFVALSNRQREILRLIGEHLHSKEIARRLGISPHTVNTHVASAREQLGVADRRDAARIFMAWERSNSLPHDQRSQSRGSDNAPSLGHLRIRLIGFPGGPWWRRQNDSERTHPDGRLAPPIRFVIDAAYSSFFLLVMSAAAYAAHRLVQWVEREHFEPVATAILRGVTTALIAIDGIGVVGASGIMMYRFLAALSQADD